jgi:hypothetical protein
LAGQDLRGVDLDIHEPAPGLVVRVEPLHKPRVAVNTAVLAASIAVERVIIKPTAIEQALALHLADDHTPANSVLGRLGAPVRKES